jgi:predicted permease
MENLWEDLRYGVRMLVKNPGFTAVAVLVLAIGIGANTAIFSLVNSMLLRPIVAENPNELVAIYNKNTTRPDSYRGFSYPNYRDLREADTVFASLMAHDLTMVGLTEGEVTRRVFAEFGSSNYFETFGVSMFRGRGFLPEEEVPGSEIPVAIVSYEHWRRHGEDPDLVGKTVTANGRVLSIVGIAPKGFTGRTALLSPELYLPLGTHHLLMSDTLSDGAGRSLADRDNHTIFVVGRLRQGLTYEEADSQLAVVAERLAEAFPAINEDYTFTVGPLSRLSVSTAPESDGQVSVVAVALLAMTGIVLLIACIDLANMMLARGTARRREFAIRVAIGGGRGRILRQLLTEGMLLSALAGIASLVVAYWAGQLLASSLYEILARTSMAMDIVIHTAPDVRVVLATAIFCVAGTLLFGFGPAWRLSRPDVMADLKEQAGEAVAPGKRGRFFGVRNLMVVSQIALSLALLTAAGLFVRAAMEAAEADPGFDPEGRILAEVDPSLVGYDDARSRELYRQLRERLVSLPGVESTSFAGTVPFGNVSDGRAVRRAEDLPVPSGSGAGEIEAVSASYVIIGGDYFRTLGLPLLRGREFNLAEAESDGAPRVAIVDEALAARLWPDEDPVGRYIGFGREPDDRGADDMEVVGVVPTVRDDIFDSGERPHVYVPHGQNFQAGMHIYIRVASPSEGALTSTMQAVRREIRALDETLPILNLRTLEDHIGGGTSLWLVRLGANMFGIIGGLALFLSVVGVYGVKAYMVAQRSREIGIRMAMGATRRDALWLILRDGMVLTAAGVGSGLILAAVIARLLSGMLYGVSALDPMAFTVAPLVLASVAMLATYLPARRAAGVDPMVALGTPCGRRRSDGGAAIRVI